MRPNFTLEYGVRYVLWPPWHSLWGNIAEFDPRYYDATKRAVVDRTAGYIVSGDPYNGIVLPGSAWPDKANGRVNVAADRSFDRLFHGLLGEAEGAVVHGDHPPRTQVKESLQRLLRAGVDAAVAVRPVGPDGE